MPRISRAAALDFLIFSLLFFVILSLAFLMPIQPNDYWWYMRVAQETIQGGNFPNQELISFSQAGTGLVYQHWLAGMSFLAAHLAGGAFASGLLRGLLVAGLYAFIWLVCRRVGAPAWMAGVLTLLAALVGSNNWAMRPQDFGYPLFGLTLWVLWRWQEGEDRHLWALPLSAVVWVNVHGSYLLLFGLGAAGVIFGGGNRLRLAKALAWSGLASLANPQGAGAWLALTDMLGHTSTQFSKEWLPPVNAGWQMNLFFGWLLAFAVAAGVSRQRLKPVHWAWFFGLGWMALSGLRYVIWFGAVLAILSAFLLAPGVRNRFRQGRLRTAVVFNVGLGIVLLLSSFLFLPGLRENWMPAAPPAYSENTPFEAVKWLKAHPELEGQLWADLAFSSYLAYSLPERPVWIYPRMETFPPSQWEAYLRISSGLTGWQDEFEMEEICLVLADKNEQADLVAQLNNTANWHLLFEDAVSILFSCR